MPIFRSDVCRAEVTDTGVLRGYAAVFDEPTTRQADYAGTETIARTAFDGLLGGDTVALVGHDMNQVLGRTSSGTLKLSADQKGLAFELQLPDTQLGRDTRELVKRGDLNGMSFSAEIGQVDRVKGGVVHRQFKRLIDVSVVAMPAYLGTEVVARHSAAQTARREQLIRARARVQKGTKA